MRVMMHCGIFASGLFKVGPHNKLPGCITFNHKTNVRDKSPPIPP